MTSKRFSYLVLALLAAQVVLVFLSWLLSATVTEGVRSLLGSEGVRWFLGHFVRLMLNPLLVWLILLAMAVGCLRRSGLPGALRSLAVFRRLMFRERIALWIVLFIVAVYILIIALLTAIPHAVLLSATGSLLPSPFSASLVPLIAFGVTLCSVVYGVVSGRYKGLPEICRSLTVGISDAAPLFLVYILLIQLYESLVFVFT